MNGKDKAIWEIRELEDNLVQHRIDFWLKYDVWTIEWWILVAFFIIPWVIWYKMADRKRLLETLLFGTLIIISNLILDGYGSDLDFWDYPTKLSPYTPSALPFDISMTPVGFMIIHQFFSNNRSYFIALFLFAILFAFVGEPLSSYLNLVLYIKWHYIYSFLYYIIIGTIVRIAVVKSNKLSLRFK